MCRQQSGGAVRGGQSKPGALREGASDVGEQREEGGANRGAADQSWLRVVPSWLKLVNWGGGDSRSKLAARCAVLAATCQLGWGGQQTKAGCALCRLGCNLSIGVEGQQTKSGCAFRRLG
eukprot:361361-Chlamydomonas_euryale.AAC.2